MLNYGNRAALTLWEMSWEELTRTPSRLTAEPVARCDGLRDLGAHQISVALAQAIHRDGDRAGFEAEVGGGAVPAFLGGVAEELAQSRERRRLDRSGRLLLQSLHRAVQHGERPLPVEGLLRRRIARVGDVEVAPLRLLCLNRDHGRPGESAFALQAPNDWAMAIAGWRCIHCAGWGVRAGS